MTQALFPNFRSIAIALAAGLALATGPLKAQELQSVDPDAAYDSSAQAPPPANAPTGAIDGDLAAPAQAGETGNDLVAFGPQEAPAAPPAEGAATATETPPATAAAPAPAADSTTYAEEDLIGAAEGVFGKGAEGLAKVIEDLLREQGEPNAYITGREAGGAFALGVRYGSGTLHHKIEGNREVYWTGPSIGFDVGANAAKTFVLVYNLHDSEELYERFPAGEGQAYFVGGLHVSYMRKGDIVLIPIRVGAGLRLGVNAGYMKFSKKQRWLPF
ncbi:MAG: DUF1134 domain-containing protein [Erythrobacter sp.]